MMKKTILTLVLAMTAMLGFAQRFTDKLDRGLVAVPASSGNLVSWHVFGEEYYDVTYNLYCNGTKIASNLEASNFLHAAGNASSKYQVAAVVKGVEQAKSAEVTRWNNGRLTIPVARPTDRNGDYADNYYTLNDVSLGDLDGDGITEFIVKRKAADAADPSQKLRFHQLDCYNYKGERLWWIDLGPNMLAGADEQWDCVCYDWDMDGKAEVLLRIQDNAIIHYADGTTQLIGSSNVDLRWNGIEYTSDGNEYLLYLEGATGKPYSIGPSSHPLWMDYPLTRESDAWWGSGIVGHRSTKHYWGAPFLDGRKAYIFLGRGCYSAHKFTALKVDPVTHQLSQYWYWQTDNGDSPWFGNGYHNFAIGDVDWDGRDEIIFGSMVIDDNGKGLSTTNYGHGDAQHCSDFDPYRKYEEQFACLEEWKGRYGNNYRNAATSQIYFKHDAGGDDGRALMANFTNAYPGSVGRSVSSGWISSVADKEMSVLGGDAFIHWSDLNQRLYWDGDLCDEYFDSPGTEGTGRVYKPGGGQWNLDGSQCNNWSKNNPGAIADIFGDWREEVVMRQDNNQALLVFTTNIPTDYRIPTLWHDHQYRNAMVWQSMGYNQPPHKSYFLGELEGITQAPPPYTMTGRTEVPNGGTITTADKHFLVCETNDTEVSIEANASPYMVTFNVPSWVQGTAVGNSTVKSTPIRYDYYTCTVTGGPLTGATRVVKQGDGILTLPKVDMTYTGETNIWAGTLNFDGTMKQSPLWLNRFAELNSDGGEFLSIKADYGSIIRPGGKDKAGSVTSLGTFNLGFGAHIELDIYSEGFAADQINAQTLQIEKKTGVWESYGPAYNRPVINIVEHPAEGASILEPGEYVIGHVGSISGALANIKIEGVTEHKAGLKLDEEGNLILTIGSVRGASEIVWTGSTNAYWNFANTTNFYLVDDESKTPDIFAKGDNVNFTDESGRLSVNLTEDLEPSGIVVNASKNYTFRGNGSILTGSLTKEGTGTLTIQTTNTYTDGNRLSGGITKVTSLSNSTQAAGNLGGITNVGTKFIIENGAELQTSGAIRMGSPIRVQTSSGGIINVNGGSFTMEKGIAGTTLIKKGSGTLVMQGSLTTTALTVAGGTFDYGSAYDKKTTLQGTGKLVGNAFLATPIFVDANAKAELFGVNRATSSNTITGTGQITIYCATEKGGSGNNVYYATRSPMKLNLSNFEGTLVIGATNNESASNGATGRVFTLDTSTGASKATIDIPADFILKNTGKTFRMGKVTGKGMLGGYCAFSNNGGSGTNTWQAGNDENFTFDGQVVDNSIFTKLGTGKMTASGAWTNTGAVNVNGGELSLKSGAKLGTGKLTVAQGATLSGITASATPLVNSSVAINGTLQPGATAEDASLNSCIYFGGKNVTFGSRSVFHVNLRKNYSTSGLKTIGNSSISNIGTLQFTSGATIEAFIGEDYIPCLTISSAEPDEFTLWTDVATQPTLAASSFILDLPELPAWNYWDTSRIQEGVLVIRCDDALYAKAVNGLLDEAGNYRDAIAESLPDIAQTLSEAIQSAESTLNDPTTNAKQANAAMTALANAVEQAKSDADIATGIQTVSLSAASDSEPWYDLNGRKLPGKPTTHGIYVKNGKKVAVIIKK